MSNNNISAPLPDATPVTGEHLNTVRQDLLWNHRHSEPGDGGPISHLSLSDKGKYTHPEIDAHIDAIDGVHGIEPGVRVVGGQNNQHTYVYRDFPGQNPGTATGYWSGPAVQLRAGIVDYPRYHFDHGANQTYPAEVTFDPPFPEGVQPVVTVTLCKGDDPQAPVVIPVVYHLQSDKFSVRFIKTHPDADVPDRTMKFTWIAVGITANIRAEWGEYADMPAPFHTPAIGVENAHIT